MALLHHKHCCVSKWAGEGAGSISALFPNYLLQAEQRCGQEDGGNKRREGGSLKEKEMNEKKEEKDNKLHMYMIVRACVCDAL